MIKAEYIDHMGDDLRVANAARVSFDKASEWVQRPYIDGDAGLLSDEELPAQYERYEDYPLALDDQNRELSGFMVSSKDSRLIAFLARENHFTPFTHCMITLRETVPIFVARQRFKHQIGFTYNEVSRRYVDDEPEFYEPEVWRKRASDKKQGSSDEDLRDSLVTDGYLALLDTAQHYYSQMLAAGVAPEQARMVLPQSMMTSYYVTGSLAAFARAYHLRSQSDAQKEIRDLAACWAGIIQPLFPVSWAALADGAAERMAA